MISGLLFFSREEQEQVNARFPECRSISVDYAIMERADEIFVFPADFGWSDLGTWMSVYCNVPKDVNGNAALGAEAEFADSHNCIVNTRGVRKVVVVGVDDCIISENEGNLLVCRMSEENRVKEFSGEK